VLAVFHCLVLCHKAWKGNERRSQHLYIILLKKMETQSSFNSSNFIYMECVGPIGSIETFEDLEDFSPQSQEQKNEIKRRVLQEKKIHALLHCSYTWQSSWDTFDEG